MPEDNLKEIIKFYDQSFIALYESVSDDSDNSNTRLDNLLKKFIELKKRRLELFPDNYFD